MKLHILGKHSDDRGTQLESLTKDLLESLGYQHLKMNLSSDAGEVDIEGEFITPLPVQSHCMKVIAECKAHKAALNMTDWLKFLGKIFMAEASGESVLGCLVALSGVNGNVQGSFQSLNQPRIRLVESTTIVDYLSKSHGLADRRSVQAYLASNGLPYLSVDLAYYQRSVYWIAIYDGGRYTLLRADGSYPDDASLGLVRSLAETSLELGSYIDLRKEDAARRKQLLARKVVMAATMIGEGRTTLEEASKLIENAQFGQSVTSDDLDEAMCRLVADGMATSNSEHVIEFKSDMDTDVSCVCAVLKDFFQEFSISIAIGCNWWDRHIDGRLLDALCAIQANVKLREEDRQKATELLRLSPSALMYALVPDPMITSHPEANALNDQSIIGFHREQFMRSLYHRLIADFTNPHLMKYFHEDRRIEGLTRETKIVLINRAEEVVISDGISETTLIAEFGEKAPNGDPIRVMVASLPNYVERRREAKLANPVSPLGNVTEE